MQVVFFVLVTWAAFTAAYVTTRKARRPATGWEPQPMVVSLEPPVQRSSPPMYDSPRVAPELEPPPSPPTPVPLGELIADMQKSGSERIAKWVE